MHVRSWGLGLVCAAALLLPTKVFAWCPPEPGDWSQPFCFDVDAADGDRAGKNITHIFVDLDFDECTADVRYSTDVQVKVDGEVIPPKAWHFRGGPCNHGEPDVDHGPSYVPRVFWFPLTGNQTTAEVCVAFKGVVPKAVTVGAKAADRCWEETLDIGACEICEEIPECIPDE